MPCNNICERYRCKKPQRASIYAAGGKRCTECEIFIMWDGGHKCPCCGCNLRYKSPILKSKERIAAITGKAITRIK